ncbi:MAG TPA: YigZ family protein [bacterium]|nr:YigZ family protein [bacterium]
MIESFNTAPDITGPFEIKEKGSRFISSCYHVKTKETVEEILKKLKKEHYNCTHICYAYLIGEGEIKFFRYNDDGEPSGTAGLPIYNEILRKNLFNVLVTSVRYYGGVNLGTGGLARTYGLSARTALENVKPVLIEIKEPVTIEVPYDLTGLAMNTINHTPKVVVISKSYNDSGTMISVNIPVASVEKFKSEIVEKSAGKIRISE